jgi:hypothetical protein
MMFVVAANDKAGLLIFAIGVKFKQGRSDAVEIGLAMADKSG